MATFCEWPLDYSECGEGDALKSLDEDYRGTIEEMAGEYLWRWTGKRYGMCETTIRPCKRDCYRGVSTYGYVPGSFRSPWMPMLVNGSWFNVGCAAGCGDSCGCTAGSMLIFEKPVAEIVSVSVDGSDLPSGAYRLDEGRFLVRQDGDSWPYCQNMTKPLGETDTWAVVVRTGTPVPAGGQVAAGKLANEFARAVCGDKNCELPRRWQSITRQGVSITAALDTFEGLDQGKTGIWLIDSWVASVTKPDEGFSLASPDYRPTGRRG
jgi:hypothetical protein